MMGFINALNGAGVLGGIGLPELLVVTILFTIIVAFFVLPLIIVLMSIKSSIKKPQVDTAPPPSGQPSTFETVCSKCGLLIEVDGQTSFCKNCGTALRTDMNCPKCGLLIEVDAHTSFCKKCGTALQ